MNFKYQAAIARAFGRFVEQGLVYKGKKPVHWCIHCRTALAEAEVEYENHTSPSIYVEFPLARDAAAELARGCPELEGRDVSVLIWTTTPWTIPSNLAIAFHPEFDYAAYDVDGRAVIVAEALAPAVAAAVGRAFDRPVARMKGAAARRHPVPPSAVRARLGRRARRLRDARSGHGRGPHRAGPRCRRLQHRDEVRSRDLRAGRTGRSFPRHGRSSSAGMRVFDANPTGRGSAQGTRPALASRRRSSHQYPHCWRCHNPVIFLATSQWFIRLDGEPVIGRPRTRAGRDARFARRRSRRSIIR